MGGGEDDEVVVVVNAVVDPGCASTIDCVGAAMGEGTMGVGTDVVAAAVLECKDAAVEAALDDATVGMAGGLAWDAADVVVLLVVAAAFCCCWSFFCASAASPPL